MNQFTVPQFIEEKPKIVGPLTFQQFIYFGIGGAVCFVLYFSIHFYLFIVSSVIILLIAGALAFGKFGGRPLPLVFINFLFFTIRPKMYLWKKKVGPPLKLIKTEKPEIMEIKKGPVLAVVGKSHLKNLSSQVEIGEKQ